MNTIHLIYFSPTQTTRTTLKSIAKGTGLKPETTTELTCTPPEEFPMFGTTDLVLIGMPVYGGRLPALAVERFQGLKGNGASIAPIVIYGNRHYDDALIELFDLCRAQGFKPVAAGAFAGEHSFSTADLKLSPGRPDTTDQETAEAFGRNLGHAELTSVPGNRPYKERMVPTGSATSVEEDLCTKCGKCIAVCPTQGMHMTETAAQADADHCIWCMACERACPENARTLTHEKVKTSAQKLNDLFSERREPETFLA